MKKHKNIFKSILFLIILSLLLVAFSSVLKPTSAEPKVLKGILAEQDNTMDYLILGDSEAYSSVSPMEIWNTKGYVGYNIGSSAQSLLKGFEDLETALIKQKPKVLLIESNFFFRDKGMVNEIEKNIGDFFSQFFPIFADHNNWKSYVKHDKKRDKPEKPSPSPLKGYHYTVDVKPYTKGNYVRESEKTDKIPGYQKQSIEKIINFAKSHDIKVVIYSAPSPSNWTYTKHNAVSKIALNNSIDYIDLNLLLNEVGIDWNTDTYDAGDHLNYSGALKVSNYLAEYLSNNTELVNKKDDPNFEVWKNNYKEYSDIIAKKKNRHV